MLAPKKGKYRPVHNPFNKGELTGTAVICKIREMFGMNDPQSAKEVKRGRAR